MEHTSKTKNSYWMFIFILINKKFIIYNIQVESGAWKTHGQLIRLLNVIGFIAIQDFIQKVILELFTTFTSKIGIYKIDQTILQQSN